MRDSPTPHGERGGRLVVGAFLTLDGVMQAPGGPDEDRAGGFDHGGWSVDHWDERMGEVMDEQFATVDALLLGRKTYEIFAGHWPHVGDEDPMAAKLNAMRKYVASRTLDDVSWTNSTLLSGDVVSAVEALKRDGDETVLVQGSHDLLQTLLGTDLVDEFWLWLFPVVLGRGKRLFDDGAAPVGLELTQAETSSTGVQMLRYARTGEVTHGSFALDDETA